MKDLTHDFKQALLSSDLLMAEEIIDALPKEEGIDILLISVLEEIGNDWEEGKVALSQVYMSGRICEDLVGNLFQDRDVPLKKSPRLAIAVLQDYHLLGLRIVLSVLNANGYQCENYGGGLSVDALIEKVIQDEIKIVLISVLMLNSALLVKELKQKCDAANLDVRIIVGGAPFRLQKVLWKEVGADAMAANASEVIEVLKREIEEIEK